MNEKHTSRRAVLKSGAAAASLGGIAGCLGSPFDDEGGQENVGYANFFAAWDWAQHVGGDQFEFENPVETGQMGHGWSPDGDLTGEIAGTEVFFYLDTPEFSWAQNVAAGLQQDYEDVRVVDLLEGMGPALIPFDQEEMPDPDPDASHDPDDLRFDEWDIFDLGGGQQLGYWHNDHWHGGVPNILLDESATVGVSLEDDEGRPLSMGESEPIRLDARTAEGEDDIVDIEVHGREVVLHGESTGRSAVVFEFYHDGEFLYDTANDPAGFEVAESFDDDGAQDFHDPHVWVDPPLVRRMVDRIADELAELDPENESVYRENAAEYNERVMGVHEQVEAVVADADRTEAVFVAHDSFQYFERRYDITLHTPTGITPDAAASNEDLSDLIQIVEDEGIDTILYDPFETDDPTENLPDAVDLLFENSPADEAMPLTPTEGTTQEWENNGWGWVEQMEEINIPALEAALNS